MAFTQILKFTLQDESREQFKQALMDSQKKTSVEDGNIAVRVYVDNANPNLVFAYDRWVDEAALENHLQQPYTKALLEAAESALAYPLEIFTLNDTNPAPVDLLPTADKEPSFNILFLFKIKPHTREQLISQFEKHKTHTRTESGCLLFDLYTVEGDETTLAVYEHWRKESDVWDIHFHQPYAVETEKLMEECVVGDMQQYMNFVTQIA